MNVFDMLQVYMQDMLRQISVWALWPVLILLILGAVYALWCIASVVVEYIMQRRHFNENVPGFVDAIEACSMQEVMPLIEDSGMLITQKDAMLQVAKRMDMAPADLYAVANREIGLCREQNARVLGRTEIAAKVAPMLGLMGTLIPLGPGIVAMGQGNTEVLSASLLVAFDTTVAGLIIAGIAIVVSKVRKGWYTKYNAALEACMTALLQKAETCRESHEALPRMAEIELADEPRRTDASPRTKAWMPLETQPDAPSTSSAGIDVMVTDAGVEAARAEGTLSMGAPADPTLPMGSVVENVLQAMSDETHAQDADLQEDALDDDTDALIEEAEQIVADSAEAVAADSVEEVAVQEDDTDGVDALDVDEPSDAEAANAGDDMPRRQTVQDGSISLDDILSAIGTDGR